MRLSLSRERQKAWKDFRVKEKKEWKERNEKKGMKGRNQEEPAKNQPQQKTHVRDRA